MPFSIINWIFEHRWAITPMALETMIEIAARNEELTPEIISRSIHGSIWEKYVDSQGRISDFWALESADYPLLEGSRRVSFADGIAILPVIGPIFPRANLMTLSGGSSVQSLAYDFNLALEHKDVKAIILNIDSPGGEVTGIAEFANMIHSAQEKKTIISYIYGMGASAAYWIASAGSEIVISGTGEAGSIGVVAAYTSRKNERTKKGIDDYEIVSSQSPNKRPDPSTEAGRAQIQTIVDNLADVFIASVAHNRGVEFADVLEEYGQGGMFVGQSAIDNGLADRIGNLEGLIKELQAETNNNSNNFFQGGSFMTLDELKTSHPEVYKEAVSIGRREAESESASRIESAKKEGAIAENKRIQDIEAINVPGSAEIVKANKFDMTKDAKDISSLILQEQKKKIDNMQANISDDGKDLASLSSGLGTSDNAPDAEQEAVVKAMVEGINNYVR